ncbi:putative serine/threonine-protein kinase Rad53 [Plasmopara halstedii]
MDNEAMTSLLQGRDAHAATSSRFDASTLPFSLNYMDQAVIRALPNANKVLALLHTIYGLCQQVQDRPQACLHVHTRLHQAFVTILSAVKHKSLRDDFHLSHFLVLLYQIRAVLDQHLKHPNLVAKMAASRRLLSELARVHRELNLLLESNGLAGGTSPLLVWKQQFAADRAQDEKSLHDTLMGLLSTPTFVNKEFDNDRSQALVLLELVAEFAATDPPRGHSSQLLETLRMTHRRISNLCDIHLRRVPRWFLPSCEVSFSLLNHIIGRSHGSFGSTLHRGEAYRYDYDRQGTLVSSATYTVAVKCLWALPDVQYHIVEQLFSRSGVSKWTRVRHPNVVTVRGASHAATPPYLVRDFTTYGGLTSYLEALETRAKQCTKLEYSEKLETLTWQLLYGASRGLLHLHEEHNIVHGGLRCNNILVDKKGRAVIADFGLYTLACDARDSELTEYFQLDVFDAEAEELIRWQAPECLREHVAYRKSQQSLSKADLPVALNDASASATSFATDVYAFGMCILEALTRTVPWAGLDIAKIRTLKGNLNLLPPRPTHISTRAWTLIENMCAADPKHRITLSEASQELKRLGYGNRAVARSHESSLNDLQGLPVPRLNQVADALIKVNRELQLLGDVTQSCDSDKIGPNIDDAVSIKHASTLLDEVSQELKGTLVESCNESDVDLEELEEQTSQKLDQMSSFLHIVSQELTRPGMNDKRSSDSRGGNTFKVVSMVQETLAELSILACNSEKLLATSTALTTAKHFDSLSSARDSFVEEVVGLDLPASSDVRMIEQTSRRVEKIVSASRDCHPDMICEQKNSIVGGEKLSNIWDLSREKLKATKHPSYDIVSSLHCALDQGDVIYSRDDRLSQKLCGDDKSELSTVKVSSNRSLDEQPEQELDNDAVSLETGNVIEIIHNLLSSDERDSDCELHSEIAIDENALSIVPAEFKTALIYDGDIDPTAPHYSTMLLLERLRTEKPDETSFVDTLVALKDALELSTASIFVEREGLLTLMELVWRNYDERCTMCALELLKLIAGFGVDFVIILIQSKLVKILLAVIKHRLSPQQVEFAASFLLEILIENDEAKRQLWTCCGVDVMENSTVINRRLVQEVKGTMAKFKRNEGIKCLENGEFHRAIDEFTEAISLDRKRAGYYADRSSAYMEAMMFEKAADDAFRCVRYNPYDVTGYLQHGLALKALGKYKEAIASLRKGLQVDPKFTKIRGIINETENLLKKRLKGKNATTVLRQMTAVEFAKLKQKDGDDALRKKDFRFAIECYTKALELSPKNDWIYLHRSIAYAACGDHSKAIEDASKCIRINYRQVEGYYRLALVLHASGQHDQAPNTLYRGQEVDSRHAGITRFISQLESEEAKAAQLPLAEWFKLKGYRAFQLRSYEDAIKFYTKAINASQSDDDEVVMHCYLYRSRANQTRGEFAAVIADCTYVLDRRPGNVFARLRRADAYEQQRDFHMALEDIRKLVAFNPNYKDAQARLCVLEHRCRLLPGFSEQKIAIESDLITTTQTD